jgi:integrase
MTLTVTAINNAKPRENSYKLADERGLYLLVTPSGGKLWRMKYRAHGVDTSGQPKRVERGLSFGAYPDVGLKQARELRDAARQQRVAGVDPAEQKRRDKNAERFRAMNSFGALALKYLEKIEGEGLAPATVRKRRWLLSLIERPLAKLPIAEIQAFDILQAIRPLEASGRLETAKRAKEFVGQVFRYAVALQLAPRDPTPDLKGALRNPVSRHLAAILDRKRVGELLHAIEGYIGQPVTQAALKLSPHVFVRPGELRRAEWREIDFEARIWRIEAAKMKSRKEHVVPLSRQAFDLFVAARELTGDGKYVFPSLRTQTRPMSENTVNGALRRLGFAGDEMTAHGFRAMASTLLNESGKWQPDAIERALAHQDRDLVRAAYNRGLHWNERVAMAQWWSDHLDLLRDGAERAAAQPSRSALQLVS